MNLLSWLNTDAFATYRDKVNEIVSGLKEGASGYILKGAGVGNNPEYVSFWSSEVVVGSGGSAPSFGSGFTQAGSSADRIRFRSSSVMGFVEIHGIYLRTGSSLANTSSAVLFTLPVGYRPSMLQSGCSRNQANNGLMTVIVDNVSGEVTIVNNSGSDFTTSSFATLTLQFPL